MDGAIATWAEGPSTYNFHRRKLPQLYASVFCEAKHAPASRMPASGPYFLANIFL